MSTSTALVTYPSEREFEITRLLDAPRDLVWEVWTDPTHLVQWFGPDGFSTTTHAYDFRVGGEWRFTMHGPDGTDYTNAQRFKEIIPPERIVYHHTGEPGSEDEHGFIATIRFAAEGSKTRVSLRSSFPTVAGMKRVIEKYGALEGGKQHLGRLAAYLSLPRAQKMVILSRMIDAPREEVWKAWTTAEGLAKWFSPREFIPARSTVDLRVGGRWSVVMRGGDGVEHDNGGTYLDIAAPERLVFTWLLEGAPGEVVMEAHHSVSLIPKGRKTRMTFVSRIITAEPGSEAYLAGVERGWGEAFDKLQATF